MMRKLILILLITVSILFAGCAGPAKPPVCTTYTIKDKFQATGPCGYSASTEYRILTTSGQTFIVADTCGISNGRMDYYDIWYTIRPGDTLTRCVDGFSGIVTYKV